MRYLIAIIFALMVSACSGRQVGVLSPVSQPDPNASAVNMLVATTRAASDDKSIMFSGERGDGLSLAKVSVSIPPDKNRQIGQVQWPRSLPANPETDFATLSAAPADSLSDVRKWFGRNVPTNKHVLIFVHGFNNRFEDAVYRFAQIVHDSGARVAPVLFTWPSRGRVFDYLYDRESTNFSRDALESTIRKAAQEPGVGEITIMAHSMGAWPTVEALRQMAIRDGRINSKIKNVILASPDIDTDVFMTQWEAFGKNPPHIYLFTSQRDRALGLSQRLSGRVTRLGRIDPTMEPYRSQMERAGVVVIDLSKVQEGDRLNHGQFAENPEIVQLLGRRLLSGQSLEQDQGNLGNAVSGVTAGLGQVVGGVAGAVVTAPIMIFDPNGRL